MVPNLVAHKPTGAVTFRNAISPSDLARDRGVFRAAFSGIDPASDERFPRERSGQALPLMTFPRERFTLS
jgi:hypothetical protein